MLHYSGKLSSENIIYYESGGFLQKSIFEENAKTKFFFFVVIFRDDSALLTTYITLFVDLKHCKFFYRKLFTADSMGTGHDILCVFILPHVHFVCNSLHSRIQYVYGHAFQKQWATWHLTFVDRLHGYHKIFCCSCILFVQANFMLFNMLPFYWDWLVASYAY